MRRVVAAIAGLCLGACTTFAFSPPGGVAGDDGGPSNATTPFPNPRRERRRGPRRRRSRAPRPHDRGQALRARLRVPRPGSGNRVLTRDPGGDADHAAQLLGVRGLEPRVRSIQPAWVSRSSGRSSGDRGPHRRRDLRRRLRSLSREARRRRGGLSGRLLRRRRAANMLDTGQLQRAVHGAALRADRHLRGAGHLERDLRDQARLLPGRHGLVQQRLHVRRLLQGRPVLHGVRLHPVGASLRERRRARLRVAGQARAPLPRARRRRQVRRDLGAALRGRRARRDRVRVRGHAGRTCSTASGVARCVGTSDRCSPFDTNGDVNTCSGSTISLCVSGQKTSLDYSKIGLSCVSASGTQTAHCG